MLPRYPELVKAQEAIVSGLEAKFGSDLPHFDPGEGHVGLCVSNLNEEWMNAVALTLGVELRNYDTVVCCVCH